ncbi:MAG: hypothetical protein GX980_03605 [Firmicutes bacterium]|nr:hypothetical protein [Bacillota bacterium]
MDKLLILALVLGLALSPPVQALEIGGQAALLWSGSLQDNDFDSELTESLDLEIFFPRVNNLELRYGFLLTRPLQGLLADKEGSYFAKKLYLKHRSKLFHLTVGRQPVSWSFGSLINPVDFTLGAETLDTEQQSKYTDAVEVYIPVNWNSSLALVLSFPDGFIDEPDRMKWGIRGRTGMGGYDVTLNYVHEAGDAYPLIPRQRLGLALKGDVGSLGVYGAFGLYFDQDVDSSRSYLAGVDYSYNLDYDAKITMQLEYLGIEPDSMEASMRTGLLKMDSSDDRLDLLIGRITYPIDYFASLSLVTMVSLDDGSVIVGPIYQNTLPGNIDLNVGATAFLGRDGALFAPDPLRAIVSIDLSYPF